MLKNERMERLRTLALLARENDLTPNKNTFAGFILKVCCTNFGLGRSVAQKDLAFLVTAWNGDKWKNLLAEEESSETESMVKTEVQKDSMRSPYVPSQSEAHKIVASIKPSGEPIKHVEPQDTSVAFDRGLTRNETAIIMYSKARSDIFDGIGRVLLSDIRGITDNKKMSVADMITIWEGKYPTIEVSQATGNVMLVYFDGKEATRFARKSKIVIPSNEPIFKPSDSGDVYDDVES